jgi:hypothetical protein
MSKHKYIETPEILWELFEEYRSHERGHPMNKTEYVGKDGKQVLTPLETPITFEGFECYLSDNGHVHGLEDYRTNKDGRYGEYANIITRIGANCFTHNFKGAAVGLFKENLISRKLGLKDQSDVTVKQEPRVFNVD